MNKYPDHKFNKDDMDQISIIDEIPLWSAPFGLALLDTIRLKPGIIALDIGTGLGFPAIELAMRLGESGKVYGLDPWKGALGRANFKINILKLRNVETVQGCAENIPFDSEFFNLVVSNNGLNNVENLPLSLAECYRVLKHNSQFTFTMNLESTMIEFYRIFEMVIRRHNLSIELSRLKEHIYLKRKPLEEVKSLVRKAGFRVRDICQKSFKMDFVNGTAMFSHYLIKYWFFDDWKNVLKPGDCKGIFDEVENEINIIASVKGLFSLTIPFVTIDCTRE